MPRHTVRCRGGCGRDLDASIHPDGMCPKCAAREARKNAEAWRDVPPERGR